MNRFLKTFLFLVCFFSLITAFSQFEKTALSKIHWSDWKWFDRGQEELSVSFRVYSKSECKELLSKDLVSRGYQPIQIDIVNPTSHEYELNPSDVSLPSEKPSKMAIKVMKSAIPRSILFKIAGLVFWPVNIVGAIDSLNSFTSFQEMNADWQAMSIHPNEKVPPFSTLHRVIFVPEDRLTDSFTIQLKDVKSGEYEAFESVASLQHLVQFQNGIQFGEVKSGIPSASNPENTSETPPNNETTVPGPDSPGLEQTPNIAIVPSGLNSQDSEDKQDNTNESSIEQSKNMTLVQSSVTHTYETVSQSNGLERGDLRSPEYRPISSVSLAKT